VTLGQRFARLTTDAVVRWPRLWPLFRRLTARQFDSIAPQWDSFRQDDSLAPFEAGLDAIAADVRDALDVGTGTGEGAMRVARRFPDANVTGVDVAGEMLALAREKAPSIRFQQADAASLPFDGTSFDLVTHANMIPFFDEVARVLRPGGYALFAFSAGDETPIYVPTDRLRAELERRGFTDFADFAAGRGTAFVARKR
jgi:ubiquinone/menaquinone biosynthesis C-methylase UbiE